MFAPVFSLPVDVKLKKNRGKREIGPQNKGSSQMAQYISIICLIDVLDANILLYEFC